MHDADRNAFTALLTATAAYYDRRLTPETIAIYWRGLADLDLDAVRAALNAHAQDPQAGQFMPKIADIRRQLEAARDDGHPGPDEAWSIALQARHEGASVVWTDEIAAAFFEVAMPLLDEGDQIAARRAFIERYDRDLAAARRGGSAAVWVASLGTDAQQRERVIDRAVDQGRLAPEHAQRLLPRAGQSVDMPALESGLAAHAGSREAARPQVAALRAMLRITR